MAENSLQKSERRWVLIFALLTMLLTSLPYILGYGMQGEAWRFTGFVFGVEDGNSYIAKMLRGAAGDWLFRTPFSAEPQQGVLAYLPYIVLGKLTAPPAQHEKLVALYHLARVIAGICMILAMYDFITLFIKDVRWRRWGIVLASWGGGLGWIALLLGQQKILGDLPLEYYSPESFGFLMLYGLPHLAMARALLFWGLFFYLRNASQRDGLYAGLLWLWMGFFQPLTAALILALVFIHFALFTIFGFVKRRKNAALDGVEYRQQSIKMAWAAAIPTILVLYTFLAFQSDPVVRQWTNQNLILSPHPLHYLLAYGLLLPFGMAALIQQIRLKRSQVWFLITWVLIFPFLIYAPYSLQRRLAEGFWVVLVVLALIAVEQSAKIQQWRYVLVLAFPSTLFLLLGGFLAVLKPAEPLFRPADEVAAFNCLAENTDGEAVVLSAYDTGNALPAWAPVFVVIGHGPETVNLAALQPRVTAFYQAGGTDAQRRALLAEFGVDYVFWGPAERALGSWSPVSAAYLSPEMQRGAYQIFKVDLSEP